MCRIPNSLLHIKLREYTECVCALPTRSVAVDCIRLFRVFYFFYILSFRSDQILQLVYNTVLTVLQYPTARCDRYFLHARFNVFFFFKYVTAEYRVFSYTAIVQRCFAQITMANCAMFAVSLPLKIAYKLVRQMCMYVTRM